MAASEGRDEGILVGHVLLVSVVAMMLAMSVEAGGGSMQETKCCDMMLEKTWAKVSWLRLAAP